jgi:hypothetical protein
MQEAQYRNRISFSDPSGVGQKLTTNNNKDLDGITIYMMKAIKYIRP